MIQSPPRRIYHQTVALRLALGILFLVAAGVFIGAGLSSDPIEYAGVVVGVLILAAYGGLWVAIGKTMVAVYSEGVRRTSVFGLRELLWSDIAEYRYQIIPIQTGGLIGGVVGAAVQAAVSATQGKPVRSIKLALVGQTRKDIRVTSNFKNAEQAIEMIVKEIHDRIKPELKSRLANGGEVSFGPLGLSVQGSPGRARSGFP